LLRSRYRWEDAIKMDLKETGVRAWTLFVWEWQAVVNTVMDPLNPYNAGSILNE
jgi:hypothetical protein